MVHAADVDSLDDSELAFAINVATTNLEVGLDAAYKQVQLWFARPGAQT